MKKFIILSVFCGFLAVWGGGFFAPQTSAAGPGDVNNDGIVDSGDIVSLINYLLEGGPPPSNPIDADVDGSPGINCGDAFQLIGYLYSFPPCGFVPYTGATIKVSKEILFFSDALLPMTAGVTQTIHITIIKNSGPDLMGMVIPISYANLPGDVEVTLNNVDFSGSIIPPNWGKASKIDNVNKRVLLIFNAGGPSGTPIPSGTIGLVANLNFTKMVEGYSHTPSVTEYPPSHSFMLFSSYCADGIAPSDRIFTTVSHLTIRGDANCNGEIEVGDVVQLLNYLFKLGPYPFGL